MKRLSYLLLPIFCVTSVALAQELAPRAYLIAPTHFNAVTFTWSFYQGGVDFNGTVPISNATGTYNVPVLSYYHVFSFFGRSANITGSFPYAFGHFRGSASGNEISAYRSGLFDFSGRLSVNLYGGPAMQVQDFL